MLFMSPAVDGIRSVGAYCWGNADAGPLGLGDLVSHDTPQALGLPDVASMALGFAHTSAIVGESLYIWGANGEGQLGDGTPVNVTQPKGIGLTDIKITSLGKSHSCALTNAGVVFCWGANSKGQLGDGTTVAKSVPTPVVWP
jgi:alpha-tubulin suppressor-like RCC1 family protein